MSGFLTAVIIVSAILIVIVVIMQPSKDGGLGGLASGGVTDSVFGTNQNAFMAKLTWVLMAIFIIACLGLAKHETTERLEAETELLTPSVLEDFGTEEASAEVPATEKSVEIEVEVPAVKVETPAVEVETEVEVPEVPAK